MFCINGPIASRVMPASSMDPACAMPVISHQRCALVSPGDALLSEHARDAHHLARVLSRPAGEPREVELLLQRLLRAHPRLREHGELRLRLKDALGHGLRVHPASVGELHHPSAHLRSLGAADTGLIERVV